MKDPCAFPTETVLSPHVHSRTLSRFSHNLIYAPKATPLLVLHQIRTNKLLLHEQPLSVSVKFRSIFA